MGMTYLERLGLTQEVAEPQGESLLIGLTGPPGVGKSFSGRFLDSLNPADIAPEFANTDLTKARTLTMRYLLARHGYRGRTHITDLQRYHAEVRRQGEGADVLNPVLAIHSSIVIIDALRHPDDVGHFKDMGGYVVGLVGPLEMCKERFMADRTDVKHTEVAGSDEAWEQAAQEIDAINKCLDLADVVVGVEQPKNAMLDDIRQAVADLYVPVLSSVHN
ncbi:MAG: hypothetical protein QG553_179 [Patescibacteria group bacterium]|nr:hypothetical protein [Patescibacteria group bacterium]